PQPGPSTTPPIAGRFGLGLLIADRGNGRLLVVDDSHRILWQFPVAGSLPTGQRFSADDAFLAPDGKTIVANDEAHQVIDRIDIVSRRVIWQYGHYDRSGSAPGYLHTPDDAYPLANGDVLVVDYSDPGAILRISPSGRVLWRYGPRSGPGRLNHPSLAIPLGDGTIALNDDFRDRVIVIDPRTNQIVWQFGRTNHGG